MTLEQPVAPASPEPAAPAPAEQPTAKPAEGVGTTKLAAQASATSKPAADAPKGAGTLLDDAGDDDTPVPAPADFPADWRDRMAGKDGKERKRLDRFKSPADVFKSYLAAEQRISSGEIKKPLPDYPTPEDVAEYRKAHGIPDKPDGYEIGGLPQGFAFGDEDKPVLADFLKSAHAGNMLPSEVNKVVGWYAARLQAQQTAMVEADRDFARAGEDELRAEWGGDYRRNVQAVNNFMGAIPGELGLVIANARGPDGRLLGNNPAIVRYFADLALEANPGTTFVAGDGSGKAMATRKSEIELIMRTDIDRYYREKLDAEYGDILGREERSANRGRKAG